MTLAPLFLPNRATAVYSLPDMEADTLILDIDWLITVDGERRVIRDAGIAIAGGKFQAVGKSADIVRAWTAKATLNARSRVALPGLIDSHLHSSFQLARGLADEVGKRPFLFVHKV